MAEIQRRRDRAFLAPSDGPAAGLTPAVDVETPEIRCESLMAESGQILAADTVDAPPVVDDAAQKAGPWKMPNDQWPRSEGSI